jgi:protoporphyrinogen oxidase
MSDISQRPAHIAVIGGGFTGMASALTLMKAGYKVTLLEAASHIGGLTGTQDFKSFRWDRFYHCILMSDKTLLKLLSDIGLEDELRWTATEVGFFTHGALHTMTSPKDLLRFPHLTLWDKFRLALGTIYAARFCDGAGLEDVPLERWTKRVFGANVYREMWEPLFRCKLGETRTSASAAFLWGTLKRLYSTRDKGSSKQERLGYVRGGYSTIFNRLAQVLTTGGVEIKTNARIERISESQAGNGEHAAVDVQTVDGVRSYDGAILTLPNRAIALTLDGPGPEYRSQLERVQYLGMVCVVLILRRQLSPYYVTNITEDCPFTGIIEMTNLIDKDVETAGLSLIYLPRYTTPDDSLFQVSDDEVWARFEPKLKHIHPDLTSDDIVDRFVFREKTVQPVPTLNYSKIVPSVQTPVPGVYLVNTAQIQNNTLNNNVMATLVEDTCKQMMRDIPSVISVHQTSAQKLPQVQLESIAIETGIPC